MGERGRGRRPWGATGSPGWRASLLVAAAVVALGVPLPAVAAGAAPALASAATGPVAAATLPAVSPNPAMAPQCGLDLALVLDSSSSILSAGADDGIRQAVTDFLTNLKGTPSRVTIAQFATAAEALVPTLTPVDDSTLAATFGPAVARYANPQPAPSQPRFTYTGDPVADSDALRNQTARWAAIDPGRGATNWHAALDLLRGGLADPARRPSLVFFLTDGDPTSMDADLPAGATNLIGDGGVRGGARNDPTTKPILTYPTDPTDATGALTDLELLARPLAAANALKAAGVHVLTVGLGAAVGATSQANLGALSGPVRRDASAVTVDNIAGTDVVTSIDYEALGPLLAKFATSQCQSSMTVTTQVGDGAGGWIDTPGWTVRATGSVSAGTASWVSPSAAAFSTPESLVTPALGRGVFQWTTSDGGARSTIVLDQPELPRFRLDSVACFRNGAPTPFFSTTGAGPWTVAGIARTDIVSCRIRNLALPGPPDLTVTKRADVADPAAVPAGSKVRWVLNVANVGGPTTAAATVTDAVPAGLVPVTGAPGHLADDAATAFDESTCTVSGQQVTCPVGAGALAGAAFDLALTTTVPARTPPGALTNVAWVDSTDDPACAGPCAAPPPCPSGGPGGPAPNTACATITIAPTPALTVEKTAARSPGDTAPGDFFDSVGYSPGQTVVFRVRATNRGNVTLTAPVVTDRVVLGLTIDQPTGAKPDPSDLTRCRVGTVDSTTSFTMGTPISAVSLLPDDSVDLYCDLPLPVGLPTGGPDAVFEQSTVRASSAGGPVTAVSNAAVVTLLRQAAALVPIKNVVDADGTNPRKYLRFDSSSTSQVAVFRMTVDNVGEQPLYVTLYDYLDEASPGLSDAQRQQVFSSLRCIDYDDPTAYPGFPRSPQGIPEFFTTGPSAVAFAASGGAPAATHLARSRSLGLLRPGDGYEVVCFATLPPGTYSLTNVFRVIGSSSPPPAPSRVGAPSGASTLGGAADAVTPAVTGSVDVTASAGAGVGVPSLTVDVLGPAGTYPLALTRVTDGTTRTADVVVPSPGTTTFSSLLAGTTYRLAETVPAGVTLASINCDNGATSTSTNLDLTFTDGQVVRCTATNVALPAKPPADLSVTKTASTPLVKGGETISYALTVRNAGPGDAHDVVLVDAPGALLTLTGPSGGGFSCGPSGTGTRCTLAVLPAGATATLAGTGVVATSAIDGTVVSNTATVASSDTDPNPGDNTSTASSTVTSQGLPRTGSDPARSVGLGLGLLGLGGGALTLGTRSRRRAQRA